jgi:hypothetical protein
MTLSFGFPRTCACVELPLFVNLIVCVVVAIRGSPALTLQERSGYVNALFWDKIPDEVFISIAMTAYTVAGITQNGRIVAWGDNRGITPERGMLLAPAGPGV